MIDRLIAFLILSIALGAPFGLALVATSNLLLNFVFFYPLFMSVIWMSGGLCFWLLWERNWPWRGDPQPYPNHGLVTVLIPCHNEARHVEQTILAALAQDYADIEVIAINDGSTDNTRALFDRLSSEHDRLRIIHLVHNQGKAMALRMGALAARSEYIVCIDGDALLAPDAVRYLTDSLTSRPDIGAVTGNPRIRTRSTLIGRIQVGEFSSIIGLIKRTQGVYGQLFTVSGVVTAFRRRALDDVDYWSVDMITEDIDVTWKLQRKEWKVLFEPRALCWVLMPETLRGLWRQRVRWAQGGAEVLLKNFSTIWRPRYRHLWLLLIDYCLSVAWAFALFLSIVLWAMGYVVELPPALQVTRVWPPAFTGMVLAMVCLFQFSASVLIDRRYEADLPRALFWVIWYPFAYWLINLLTTLYSFPKVMVRGQRKRARWTSPDRGIEELT